MLKTLKHWLLVLSVSVIFVFNITSDDSAFSEQDLNIITKLVSNILLREHYSQKVFNDEFSSKIFDEYLKILDPNKIYFTKEDIAKLSNYRNQLDDMALKGDFSFAFNTYDLLLEKISEFNSYAEKLVADGINFNEDEEWEADRTEADWPKDQKEQKVIWKKKIKNDILIYKLILKSVENDKELKEKKQDEIQWIKAFKPEERALKRYSNYIRYLKDNTPIEKLELFLNAVASVFDPYSAYMAPKSMEDFNIQMSLSLTGIGATLTQQDGYTKIIDLVPGGPAEKSGKLHPGDRIIAVAQENEPPIDVIDMPLTKVVSLIRGKKDTIVKLTILPAKKGLNAPPVTVEIRRDKITLKDQEAQYSLILHKFQEKKYKIAVIKLDSFYFDWHAMENGGIPKSSTTDVKRILQSLEKENIDGLIMDMRSNGGGSLYEAISLTGLFIEKGPVVLVRSRDGKIEEKSDTDTDVVYKGPMAVMVNKLSASATEIFAGAIRDYNRGVIIGDSQTHGKGSVQTIVSLNDFLKYWGLSRDCGSVKVTNAKFYRINGESTQKKGVIPDLILPSITDSMDLGEAKLKNALEWDTVTALEYKKWMPDNTFEKIIAKL
ncbi:MAG TPA: S41 family peptidase, partial [Victivallales bacterium]|nr:S41 family peptidase [Victivallales bacterium]